MSALKFNQKIFLDRVVLRPIALFLNCIVRPVGILLNRNHDLTGINVKTIVIAKLVGMGSICRATPMIREIRNKYPHAKVVVLTSCKNRMIAERLNNIDMVLYVDDLSIYTTIVSSLGVLFRFWQLRVDLYFDLEVYSAYSTLLATFSLARNRYGFYRESTAFRLGLHTHLVYFNDNRNISWIYMMLAKACGVYSTNLMLDKPTISRDDSEKIQLFLTNASGNYNSKYIVINPNASELLSERKWPGVYFAELINVFSSVYEGTIFLIGSADEFTCNAAIYEKLTEKSRATTFNIAGKLPFGQVLSLIEHAQCMLTNDSGLFHIALSLGTKTVSLWGPGNRSHYADYEYVHQIALQNNDIYCSPCIYRVDKVPCQGNNKCMQSIHPVSVLNALSTLCSVSSDLFNTASLESIYKEVNAESLNITMTSKRLQKTANN
ncbi:MAG: glycosyltransferase family 9 protein [Fibrobacter sp.]|nr:glycosyltransferase family 9 protein [Fibrobacter sp.]